jgi:hypothetical protein
MAAPGRTTPKPALGDAEADISLAGWDPYIVAITGGGEVNPASGSDSATQATDSRESRLMAWLREHGA